jgi:hypothetical protein
MPNDSSRNWADSSRRVRDPSGNLVRGAALSDSGYIGLNAFWPSAIIKRRRAAGAPAMDWSHMDADRVCVECFFGRIKRVFLILCDHTFRLAGGKLGPCVQPHVSPSNFRHRFRGRGLTTPPHGFLRMVPQSIDLSSAPPGSSLEPLAPRPRSGNQRLELG